ncbi:MAG: UDP-N-acetylglucosamine 1-carboxyvinyltransferase [Oscillospiraceae bacterium]
MNKLIVKGTRKLFGTVAVPVGKNATLPIIAASLMLDGETQIKDCPKLSDIYASAEIVNSIGCVASPEHSTLSILYTQGSKSEIPRELCKRMRSSVLYLAPLLYRTGRATIFSPGGCSIGKRPIDIHLDGLRALGAKVYEEQDRVSVTAPEGLKGTIYKLKVPSVGATQTLVMAAAVAQGVTVLKNCAKEPEVVDLIRFLNLAGAKIMGAGRSEIVIRGVCALKAIEYTPIADRVFAATVLSGVCACKGLCVLKNYPQEYMRAFEEKLEETGLHIVHFLSWAYVFKMQDKRAYIDTHTGYYPGFSTDMGPLLSAAMLNNKGRLALKETVFENRFSYKAAFEKLGAKCSVRGNIYAQTRGRAKGRGALEALDLRAGAAIVIAALSQKGEFEISGLEFIDRGYENIEGTFSRLGANIRREIVG